MKGDWTPMMQPHQLLYVECGSMRLRVKFIHDDGHVPQDVVVYNSQNAPVDRGMGQIEITTETRQPDGTWLT